MKLYAKCKKVQIRVESGGKLHDSLESLRNYLVLADIKPAVNDGRLTKWLKGIGENEIAGSLPAMLETESDCLQLLNVLFNESRNSLEEYLESIKSVDKPKWWQEAIDYIEDEAVKRKLNPVTVENIEKGIIDIEYKDLENQTPEIILAAAKKKKSQKLLHLASVKRSVEARNILDTIKFYEWRVEAKKMIGDCKAVEYIYYGFDRKRIKYYQSAKNIKPLKQFLDDIHDFLGSSYFSGRSYPISNNITNRFEHHAEYGAPMSIERSFLLRLFDCKLKNENYPKDSQFYYGMEKYVLGCKVLLGVNISGEYYIGTSFHNKGLELLYEASVTDVFVYILDNLFNVDMYPKWKEVEQYMQE